MLGWNLGYVELSKPRFLTGLNYEINKYTLVLFNVLIIETITGSDYMRVGLVFFLVLKHSIISEESSFSNQSTQHHVLHTVIILRLSLGNS